MATGVSKVKWNGALSFSGVSLDDIDYQLVYKGKKSEAEIFSGQRADCALFWNTADCKANTNTLFWGENKDVLLSLLDNPKIRGQVKLVYIDPPYATNSVFQSKTTRDAYTDLLKGAHYLEFIRERLIIIRELLSPTGSIYLHLDENKAFEVKLIMDEIFGKSNFRNWITRKKCSTKNTTKKRYGDVSDYILFYTKTDSYTWNRPFDEWSPEKIAKEYPCIDEKTGKLYKKVPIHAPGLRNGATGTQWKGRFPPPGKHWQLTPSKLDELDANGDIYWSDTGNPRRKVYFEDSQGIPVQDIWLEHRDSINQNMQLTGYPTEKNLQMLEMIVKASSNPGDLVLDCFCGSGTTLHAAYLNDRTWIGVDNSFEAICSVLKRFHIGLDAMGDYVNPADNSVLPKTLLNESCFTPSLFGTCPLSLFVQDVYWDSAKEML